MKEVNQILGNAVMENNIHNIETEQHLRVLAQKLVQRKLLKNM